MFSTTDPSIVEIVLKEIWDFVNLSKYKPLDLWIFLSSFFMSLGPNTTFKEKFQ